MKRVFPAILFFVTTSCAAATATALAQGDGCQPSRRAKLPAISDVVYHKARKRLLAAGWRPVKIERGDEAEADASVAYGNGPVFRKRGYPEVESCSGTGVAACAFLFEDKYGNRLRVTTAGEEMPKQKSHARVSGLRFVCERLEEDDAQDF